MTEVESELNVVKQKYTEIEKKWKDTTQTLKKTLNILDEKDQEITLLKQETDVLKERLKKYQA